MKKNLRAISIFAGCISASLALMILGALTPKQDLYLLGDNQIVSQKIEGSKQISNNYTFLAFILLTGALPFTVISNFVVSNRLPEIELEAEEYNKQRMIRKIRKDSELETEKELCDANKTVTVTAHEKNLESAFIELAEASDWHYVSNEQDEDIIDSIPSALAALENSWDLKKNG